MILTGRCACGACGFAARRDAVLWCGHCHCESCRRQAGAAFVTWFGVADGGWRWTGAAPPRARASSPGVTRHFCPDCGTPMGYRRAAVPGVQDLPLALVDDSGPPAPGFHAFWPQRVPWLRHSDDLPRHSADAPDGGD